MLDGWRKFIRTAEKDTIYVFNCCFMQNPMCETMMRFGFDYEISRQYILSIWQIIKELNPVIIYLRINYGFQLTMKPNVYNKYVHHCV